MSTVTQFLNTKNTLQVLKCKYLFFNLNKIL